MNGCANFKYYELEGCTRPKFPSCLKEGWPGRKIYNKLPAFSPGRGGWLFYVFSYFYYVKNYNIFSRKELKPFRAELRNNSTSAEAALWNILKSKKLEGRKFRRQHSIGSFIVDFCCPSEKLIVELDGAPHGEYLYIPVT